MSFFVLGLRAHARERESAHERERKKEREKKPSLPALGAREVGPPKVLLREVLAVDGGVAKLLGAADAELCVFLLVVLVVEGKDEGEVGKRRKKKLAEQSFAFHSLVQLSHQIPFIRTSAGRSLERVEVREGRAGDGDHRRGGGREQAGSDRQRGRRFLSERCRLGNSGRDLLLARRGGRARDDSAFGSAARRGVCRGERGALHGGEERREKEAESGGKKRGRRGGVWSNEDVAFSNLLSLFSLFPFLSFPQGERKTFPQGAAPSLSDNNCRVFFRFF